MSRRFLFVLGSARTQGNTEFLARTAAEQLPEGVEQEWIRLAGLPLPEAEDLRHDSDHVRPTADTPAGMLLDATLAATDVVIASPLYWYSLSSLTKRYLDHWSGWLRIPEVGFKDTMAGRTMWGVTALADRDPAVAEPPDRQPQQLRRLPEDALRRGAAGQRQRAGRRTRRHRGAGPCEDLLPGRDPARPLPRRLNRAARP